MLQIIRKSEERKTRCKKMISKIGSGQLHLQEARF